MNFFKKERWKSLRIVSLMKRFLCSGSSRAWFRNTTSSFHLLLIYITAQSMYACGVNGLSKQYRSIASSNSSATAPPYFRRVLLYVCERVAFHGRILVGPLLQQSVLPVPLRLCLLPLGPDTLQLCLQLLLIVILIILVLILTGINQV